MPNTEIPQYVCVRPVALYRPGDRIAMVEPQINIKEWLEMGLIRKANPIQVSRTVHPDTMRLSNPDDH